MEQEDHYELGTSLGYKVAESQPELYSETLSQKKVLTETLVQMQFYVAIISF